MNKIGLILFGILFSFTVEAQVNELNFVHQLINFSAPPRTTVNPMSLKLWDSYDNGGPSTYGTIMEICGKSGHQTSQLHFGGWDNSRIRYREAFYAQDQWSDWITLLDSKNDIASAGKLLITGIGNHSIAGNLSIGTLNPTPGALLTVAGLLSCKEVKVAITAGADHVFSKDYELMQLPDLENYVKVNKHLPEIASESDMKNDGLNVNEFQIKLLQKIEELTLYIIDLKKQNLKADAKIEQLESITKTLNNKMNVVLRNK